MGKKFSRKNKDFTRKIKFIVYVCVCVCLALEYQGW